jgi:hypothetical protein
VKHDPWKNAFDTLKEIELPTAQQKDIMLNNILLETRQGENSAWQKFHNWITIYPWRFAFSVSTVQTALFSLVFGSKYTNLLLNFLGG